MLKFYALRDYEVSEDVAIFAESWYEALEGPLYSSFSEFLTDCVRVRTKQWINNPRSEKVSQLLKEKGWSNSHSFDIPGELYQDLELVAGGKGLTVDQYAEKLLNKILQDLLEET